MSQFLLRRMAQPAQDESLPIDAARVRSVLTSIRDCAEWQGIPDHLKLYWISAYINSLLCRMAVDRKVEADEWLAQCHALSQQMRIALGEESTL